MFPVSPPSPEVPGGSLAGKTPPPQSRPVLSQEDVEVGKWIIQAQEQLNNAEAEQCHHGGRVKEGLAAAVAEAWTGQGLP